MLKFHKEVQNVMMDFLKREGYYNTKDIMNWINCRVLLKILTKDKLSLGAIVTDLKSKFTADEFAEYSITELGRHPDKNTGLNVANIIILLRKLGMNVEQNREDYATKVRELYELLLKVCDGDREAYDEFTQKHKEYISAKDGGKRKRYIPLGILLLLTADRENLLGMRECGNIGAETRNIPWMKAKFLISDIKDEIGWNIGAKKRRKDTSELIDNVKLIVEETSEENEEEEEDTEKVETIESLRLERDQYRSSLKLIEKNMDVLLERIKEETENIANEQIRDFFVSLNSGKYGNFLDKMPLTEETLKDIRKKNLDRDLPQEVKRVLIFIKAVLKFINDQGITPIRPINEVFEGTAEDIAKMDYSGSPFIGNEKKELKIVASGYKYKDMIISIPKVEEVE